MKNRTDCVNDSTEMFCNNAKYKPKYYKKYLKYTIEFLLAFFAGLLVRYFLGLL